MKKSFDMPWRAAYEFYAAIGWAAALVFLFIGAIAANLPTGPFWYMASVAVLFLAWNMNKAWGIWTVKFALSGIGVDFLKIAEIKRRAAENPSKIWLGYGFDWRSQHTQRIYDLKRANPSDFYPPTAFLKVKEILTGKKVASIDENAIGAPWIHGVEPDEKDVDMFIDNLIGNTLIVGTTRCGKTRMLDVLFSQFIFRPTASVIVIDPKGDIELRENMRRAAIAAGREADFKSFHLGFPAQSIRIDTMKNYTNLSELASRIAALIPSDSEGMDSFTAVAWKLIQAIILGLVEVNEKPSLVSVRKYVESGIEPLFMKVLPAYFAKNVDFLPDWERKANEYISRARKRDKDGNMVGANANPREVMFGHLMMYEALYVAQGKSSETIGLIAEIMKGNAEHLDKMVAQLKPILVMLTTGEYGPLLSPDGGDIEDERLSTDFLSLTDSRSIVYIGLNALADKTVASAIGSLFLSDLTAVAAFRYNYRSKQFNDDYKIYLGVDEAAQIVNDPYIQMLNMSAGAGFVNLAATQTISDFAARLGSEDKARVMLGNFNNLFALRSKDRNTQDFIIETFGETYVTLVQTAKATTSTTEKNITHFGGSIGEKVGETLEALFPPELLGMLPNWQYIASISGGRIVKGRVPILQGEKTDG